MKKIAVLIAVVIAIAGVAFWGFGKKGHKMEKSRVYFTRDISPTGLRKVHDVMGQEAESHGRVAVKISTGEPGGHNFLSPELIKSYVQNERGTIVECNTGYAGKRRKSVDSIKTAEDHGFTKIAKFDLLDVDGEIALPIKRGIHLKQNFVGSHFHDYDFWIILSHFKGHAMGGFGGALKNISIGIASGDGKLWIHSAGKTKDDTSMAFGTKQDDFLESMADAAASVIDAVGPENIIYINVLNKLSVDCDCDSHPADPEMVDIGIMASMDPVALDRASVDAIYKSDDPGKKALIERIESRNGTLILDAAEKLGIGTQEYDLIDIDQIIK